MITLEFERDLEEKAVTARIAETDADNGQAYNEDEYAWAKLGLEFAHKLSKKYDFELNLLRDEVQASITITVTKEGAGREVDIVLYASEGQDTIGGMTSATLSTASVVYTMLCEARQGVGRPTGQDEDDDEADFNDPSFEFDETNIPDEHRE